jgi:hypothetical protein
MFSTFRRILEANKAAATALQGIEKILETAIDGMSDGGDLDDRVGALELQRAIFEADMDGLVTRAEGKLKAANNAEARTRTMKRSYETYADELDEDRPTQIETEPLQLPQGDGAIIQEPLPQMPLGMEANNKAHPTRMKFL